jgi:signal transduction histidine kinase
MTVWWRIAKGSWKKEPEAGGRLQQLVESGNTGELARRAMTLQSVLLDLHRQLASVSSQEELARTMALALVGSFACERLVVLRTDDERRGFRPVAHRGDVSAALLAAGADIARSLAPFLPHAEPLAPLQSASPALEPTMQRCAALGIARAAWLNVDRQVDWVVLVGPKLSGREYDEFDRSMLQATFDAAGLACSRLLLVGKLEERNRERSDANDRLLHIDDLKSAILTGVSHELRTPLTRILSYAEAIRDTDLSVEERQACVDIILGSTRTLSSHVDRALAFAQLIGGRTTPRSERVELDAVVEDVVLLQAANAREHGITLEQKCIRLAALTDVDYVRMILKNLLDNAIKFTPRGGHVRVELVAEAGGATLFVTDNGPGIPEEARARIWRLFEHGDISLRRESEGLGLGLALAQRLALELALHLDLARSGPDGSVFRMHFAEAAPATSERLRGTAESPESEAVLVHTREIASSRHESERRSR